MAICDALRTMTRAGMLHAWRRWVKGTGLFGARQSWKYCIRGEVGIQRPAHSIADAVSPITQTMRYWTASGATARDGSILSTAWRMLMESIHSGKSDVFRGLNIGG